MAIISTDASSSSLSKLWTKASSDSLHARLVISTRISCRAASQCEGLQDATAVRDQLGVGPLVGLVELGPRLPRGDGVICMLEQLVLGPGIGWLAPGIVESEAEAEALPRSDRDSGANGAGLGVDLPASGSGDERGGGAAPSEDAVVAAGH
jgi:hypothetical protein